MNLTTKTTMAATVLLLVAALVLAVLNYSEMKQAKRENRTLTERLAAQDGGGTPVSGPAADLERRIADLEQDQRIDAAQIESGLAASKAASEIASKETAVLNDFVEEKIEEKQRELTPLQKKILNAASIGEVVSVNAEWGFVTINAGASQNVEPGTVFAVRRDEYVVGRIVIETAEKESSVGNIESGSIAPGQAIQSGDSLIRYPVL